jgi:hypothetical protein
MPPYVMIPRMLPGAGSAYLGVAHKPFETQADPAQPGPFKLPNFQLASGVTMEQVGDRKALLKDFDKMRRDADRSGQLDAADKFQMRAWEILTSPAARDAFDLDKEPMKLRDRYGFMPAFDPKAANRCGAPNWAQRMILARRLVEAGVRLVTVDVRWWDTHVKGFESLRLGFLPRWDRAYTALIEDLEDRGLLDTTLVLAWGEFGRTPKVNADAGRDHYPNVFSAAFAGGPVKGGRVVGESDSKGAFPKANPKTPQDVLATVYHHLGVDTEAQYMNNGRPIPCSRAASRSKSCVEANGRREPADVSPLLVTSLCGVTCFRPLCGPTSADKRAAERPKRHDTAERCHEDSCLTPRCARTHDPIPAASPPVPPRCRRAT